DYHCGSYRSGTTFYIF
nr:immunoglobulin light chain junction region [Macaca mulatta]MOW15393.1 immunoglobulin light chain junction region [Macaca mulatta]MOW15457.1 immunoglobulin light chain junction region [Macaca mulatta]MOW16297.1 immunoglobulin light chain junction region [Macaca mulatta]MOW16441.1 immunoglobulin light chain junction region [Macaca mulatta]